jgi:hypothetical protein
MGFRLVQNEYVPISDLRSEALGLQLAVEGKLIAFTELATGRRLLTPEELSEELKQEQNRVAQERSRAERLKAQLPALGVEPVE